MQIVRHGGEVAAGELRPQGAGVEQGGGAAHEVEAGEQGVELDGAGFAVDLVDRQAHRHAHVEGLRQLEAGLVLVDEVAVVEGLQAQVVELHVALGQQRFAQLVQVIQRQLGVDQLFFHRPRDVGAEVVAVQAGHVLLGGAGFGHAQEAHGFVAHRVQQQPRGHVGVVRLLLDPRARGHGEGRGQLLLADAVVEVTYRRLDDLAGVHARQARAGLVDHAVQAFGIQRRAAAVVQRHGDAIVGHFAAGLLGLQLGVTGLGALGAVDHVVAGHLVLAGAHQRQFHVILDVLYMDGAAAGQVAGHALDHLFGQPGHQITDA